MIFALGKGLPNGSRKLPWLRVVNIRNQCSITDTRAETPKHAETVQKPESKVSTLCGKFELPAQLCVHGEEGAKQFRDFKGLMEEGGSFSNLAMGPEEKEKLLRVGAEPE